MRDKRPLEQGGTFFWGRGSLERPDLSHSPLAVNLEHFDNIEHHPFLIFDMQVAGHGGAKLDNIHQLLFCTNISESPKDDVSYLAMARHTKTHGRHMHAVV